MVYYNFKKDLLGSPSEPMLLKTHPKGQETQKMSHLSYVQYYIRIMLNHSS